jgi:hypothetical protein
MNDADRRQSLGPCNSNAPPERLFADWSFKIKNAAGYVYLSNVLL